MTDEKNINWQSFNLTVSEGKIETVRLKLCQPIAHDFGVLRDLWRDMKVRRFLGGIISAEEIDKKIDSIQDHWKQHAFGLFSVYEKNTTKLIGLCGLHYSEDGVEISYMFFPIFWGNGLATEAVLASLHYGFNFLKLEEIIAITQEANRSSWLLLEKVGMNYSTAIRRFDAQQRVYKILASTSSQNIRTLGESEI